MGQRAGGARFRGSSGRLRLLMWPESEHRAPRLKLWPIRSGYGRFGNRAGTIGQVRSARLGFEKYRLRQHGAPVTRGSWLLGASCLARLAHRTADRLALRLRVRHQRHRAGVTDPHRSRTSAGRRRALGTISRLRPTNRRTGRWRFGTPPHHVRVDATRIRELPHPCGMPRRRRTLERGSGSSRRQAWRSGTIAPNQPGGSLADVAEPVLGWTAVGRVRPVRGIRGACRRFPRP